MLNVGHYACWLTLGIDVDNPNLLRQQYSALSRQIPILYAILVIASISMTFVSFGKVPSFLTIDIAPIVCVFCGLRGVAWHRKRLKPTPSTSDIIYILNTTTVLGLVIAVLFVVWNLTIFIYSSDTLRINVAVFVSMTTLGCAFCMMQIPVAAVWLALIVFIPTNSIFIATGSITLISVSGTSTAIYITVVLSLFSYFEKFRTMVEAQTRLQTQAAEIARLHSNTIATEKRRVEGRNADLERIAEAFTGSIAGVTCVISEVATKSSVQAREVAFRSDQALQRLGNVTLTAGLAQETLKSVDASTISLFKAIESIKSRMGQWSTILTTLGARTDIAENAMQSLDGAVKQIDDIATMIKAIADQINLIALNAAIEAAHAGTYGRGFAIVASEIKILADQTGHAIEDVARLIKNVKTASHDARSSVVATKDAFVQFRTVSEAVSDALETQSIVTVDIRSCVEKAVDGAAVMQADLTQMGTSAGQTHISARGMLNQCKILQEEMNVLACEVNKFIDFIKVA